MSYGIVAQFVERKNKLFVYEVRGFDGGSFETMLKQNANNYRGLRQVKNPDEPDGAFKGCFYEPKMETTLMAKDDDQTDIGLAITTTFTFTTNDNLTFLQETRKFYVFTVNQEFIDNDNSKVYILNGQAIRMTKESGDIDLKSRGLPTNRNFNGEMGMLGLQEASKLINTKVSNLFFYKNVISELPDETEVWIDKNFEIGVESDTLINQIYINADIYDTQDKSEFKSVNLDLEIFESFLFPIRCGPIDIQNNQIFLYLHDYDKTRMSADFIKEFLQIPSADPDNQGIKERENRLVLNQKTPFRINSNNLPAIIFEGFSEPAPVEYAGIGTLLYVDVNANDRTANIGNYDNASIIAGWKVPSIQCIFNNLYISTAIREGKIWIINPDTEKNTTLIFQIKENDAYGGTTPFDFIGEDRSISISTYHDDMMTLPLKRPFFNFYKFTYATSSFLNNPSLIIGGKISPVNSILLNFYITNNKLSMPTLVSPYNDERHLIIGPLTGDICLRSNFFNIYKKVDLESSVWLEPKINNISFPVMFSENIYSFNFPLLPDKLTDAINISTDLSQIDLKTNDFLKYLCFIPCKDIETFNKMFHLLDSENNNLINRGKMTELHEKIDPGFAISRFNKCNFKIVGQFAKSNYQIKKINSFTIKNLFGDMCTKKIRFGYKNKDDDAFYDFYIEEMLFSQLEDTNTTTITIL